MKDIQEIYNRFFEAAIIPFAVVVFGLVMLSALYMGFFVARDNCKELAIVHNRLDVIQSSLDETQSSLALIKSSLATKLTQMNDNIIKQPKIEDIILTNIDVFEQFGFTPDELVKLREKGLKHSYISNKIFYFKQDIIDFIKKDKIILYIYNE